MAAGWALVKARRSSALLPIPAATPDHSWAVLAPRYPPSPALQPVAAFTSAFCFPAGFGAEGLLLRSPPTNANQVISPSQPHQIAL